MWPFRKKEVKGIELPLFTASKSKEIIELLPEEFIPEELPPLDVKMVPAKPEAAYKGPVFPTLPAHRPMVKERGVTQPFISTELYKDILSQINNTSVDFDKIDFEIGRAIEFNETRSEKTDGLQRSLEEISKKLLYVDATLFGG